MSWFSFISLLIQAVVNVSDYLTRKQLLEAGQAEATSKILTKTLKDLQKAKDVSTEIKNNPTGKYANSVRNKYTRDDKGE